MKKQGVVPEQGRKESRRVLSHTHLPDNQGYLYLQTPSWGLLKGIRPISECSLAQSPCACKGHQRIPCYQIHQLLHSIFLHTSSRSSEAPDHTALSSVSPRVPLLYIHLVSQQTYAKDCVRGHAFRSKQGRRGACIQKRSTPKPVNKPLVGSLW